MATAPEPGVPELGVPVLAAALRARRLRMLTAEVSQHVLAALPDYPGVVAVTAADLRAACADSVEALLRELAGEGDPLSLSDTGRRRAQEGLPLEWLLHGFRVCGRVIWQGLVTEAARAGGDGPARLLDEAVVVWDALERVSTLVAKAYREEQSRLRRTTRRRRELVLSALLDRPPVSASAGEEAGEVLGMPVRGGCVVVVSTVGNGHPETALRAVGIASAWVTQGARDVGLLSLEADDALPRAVAALSACLPGAVTVSPRIEGFDEVAAAHRLAVLTLRTLPAGYQGIARVTDRLPHTLVAGVPDVADVLVRHTLGGLLTMRAADRELYFATLEALVDADGSFAGAARKLYCHRNTVLKRAHRIEALTGCRLTSTRALVELYLAVLAVRMDGNGRYAVRPQ